MGFFDQSQYHYFLKNFFYFLILLFIVFYINLYIEKKAKSTNVVNYNRTLLYLFIAFLGLFITDIMVSEQKLLNKFIYMLIFCILSIFISVVVVTQYFYDGLWMSAFYLFIAFLLILGLFGFSFWYAIKNNGEVLSEPVFLQFNYAVFENKSLIDFCYIFFLILGLLFYIYNYNNAFGRWATQNILGLFTFIFMIYLGFHYAFKTKLLNNKQILNASLVMICISYFMFIMTNYILLSSLTDICNGKKPAPTNKSESNKVQFLNILLIASIIIILMLDDNRSWSFYNYLSFLLISIYIFICLSSLTVQYPQLGPLTLWGFIEWIILITYNTHDTFNSFSLVMMDNKYNLIKKSENVKENNNSDKNKKINKKNK